MNEDNPMDAGRLIAAFGGIRPMAKKIGVAVTTVQGWKERGAIPVARMGMIREAARREGIDLDNLPAAEDGGTPPDAAEAGGAASESDPVRTGGASRAEDEGGTTSEPEDVAAERVERYAHDTGSGGIRDAGSAETVIEDEPAQASGGLRRPLALGAGFGLALAIGALAGWQFGLMEGSPTDGYDLALLQQRVATASDKANRNAEQLERLREQLGETRNATPQSDERTSRLEARIAQLGEAAGAVESAREELAGIRETVAGLSDQVTGLAAQSGDPDAVNRALEPLRTRLQEMEGRLAEFDQRIGEVAQQNQAQGVDSEALDQAIETARAGLARENAELRERLDAAEGRLQSLATAQQEMARGAPGEAAIVLALGQLQRAVDEGESYVALLDHLRRLAGEREGFRAPVDTLGETAETGVATRAALRTRFDDLSVEILRAASRSGNGDWSDRAWGQIRALVSVRRTGADVEGNDPAAIVSRTEARLGEGNVGAAVAEIEKLEGPAAETAARWLSDARVHIKAQDAIARLNQLAIGVDRSAGADEGSAPARDGDN